LEAQPFPTGSEADLLDDSAEKCGHDGAWIRVRQNVEIIEHALEAALDIAPAPLAHSGFMIPEPMNSQGSSLIQKLAP
jgi:hypothetical protein